MSPKSKPNNEKALSDIIERWRSAALALKLEGFIDRPGRPIHVTVAEAVTAARLADRYWKPDPTRGLPGLASVEKRLAPDTPQKIRELAQAVHVLQAEITFPRNGDETNARLLEQASELCADLRASLGYYLDDYSQEAADLALATARERESDGSSAQGLCQNLWDYAAMAEKKKEGLKNELGFDPSLIQSARNLATKLEEQRAAATLGRPASPEIELRNRFVALLEEEVAKVRRAARFVFRKQPAIVRQFTSAYDRRQRAVRRKRSDAAAEEKVDEISDSAASGAPAAAETGALN